MSVEWRHQISHQNKKLKANPLAEKFIVIGIMPPGQTVNSDIYILNFKTFHKLYRWFRPYKSLTNILLQHENA
jgi:hypothetical protein